MTTAPVLVVMGVSGSGKSTVGAELAERLDVPFVDGDDLHPAANIARMGAGEALTDEDRWPWLDAVGEWLAQHPDGGVVACSALRRAYRDRLRSHAPDAWFVHLDGDPDLVARRQADRRDHFMPSSLQDSQQATLEPLGPDEAGAGVDVALAPGELVDRVLAHLPA
jgi:gluconokinase